MPENNTSITTLKRCFEELSRSMPRAPQVEAVMPEEIPEDSCELCVLLAERFQLQPDLRLETTLDELSSHFGSPVFLHLKNLTFRHILNNS